MSESVKLEFTAAKAKQYRGHDPITKSDVIVRKAGTVVEVSAEKAKQLLKDFPKDFKPAAKDAVVGEPKEKKAEVEAPPAPPAPPAAPPVAPPAPAGGNRR